jgi:cyclopropane-fatty-acyl-phospholipid synthase
VNDTTLVEQSRTASRTNPLGALARRLAVSRLEMLREGRLCICEGDQTFEFGIAGAGPVATIVVADPAFYAELAFGGSIGAGESYMLGHWHTPDLPALLRLMLRNRRALDALETGVARFAVPLRLLAHWMHRNTRSGSRRNISAHYDLGNEFFQLFLDETMMYSCALFQNPSSTLTEASIAKLDSICQKLELGPQDHVLEIGTGWGGFALHAAGRYGCRVTTTTISPSQYALAVKRIHAAGLADRITLLCKDYRELSGRYDKLVSIEMIESVGHQFFDEFFRRCAQFLAPGGKMLLQSITVADRLYERTRKEVDFIKRYIFPGCCIPSISVLAQALARSSDLRMVQLNDIGPHYATTLARWRENFFANLDRIRALGLPLSFVRMWEYYLCYCEAGFAEHALGDVQILLTREC